MTILSYFIFLQIDFKYTHGCEVFTYESRRSFYYNLNRRIREFLRYTTIYNSGALPVCARCEK